MGRGDAPRRAALRGGPRLVLRPRLLVHEPRLGRVRRGGAAGHGGRRAQLSHAGGRRTPSSVVLVLVLVVMPVAVAVAVAVAVVAGGGGI